jgi:transposase-like protein
MENNSAAVPETMVDTIRYFADPDTCLSFLVGIRWPDGVVCPRCGRGEARFLASRRVWQCKSLHDHRQFSIKTGTIFEDSPLPLEKWLPAIWMIVNDKNGISSYEVARGLGVTQKTAWLMLHRIRLAMQRGSLLKLKGQVEADETFIGGKARNMHKGKRAEKIKGATGMVGKVASWGCWSATAAKRG